MLLTTGHTSLFFFELKNPCPHVAPFPSVNEWLGAEWVRRSTMHLLRSARPQEVLRQCTVYFFL